MFIHAPVIAGRFEKLTWPSPLSRLRLPQRGHPCELLDIIRPSLAVARKHDSLSVRLLPFFRLLNLAWNIPCVTYVFCTTYL
jgi:hypothetical protein